MNNIKNPYIIGRPIRVHEPGKFFGREQLFNFIEYNLNNDQQTILLFGQRRIGKSSILFQISQFIQPDEYFFVIFDLGEKDNLPLSDVLCDLARKIIESLHLSDQEIQLPSITQLKQTSNTVFFNEFLTTIYERLNNRNLVLLLDEFDAFIGGNEFLKLIRNNGKKIFCIPVLGRNIDDTNKLIADFHDAPNQEISLLDKNSAINLITKPAQNVLEYRPDAITAILELTAGHPYLTQVICFSLFTQARDKNKWVVDSSDVQAIIANAIEISEAGLAWLLNALSIPEQVLFLAVAELQEPEFISSNLTFMQLLEQYGLVKTNALEKAAKKLVEWRFLERIKNSNYYKVKIELVRLWLLDKYSLKELIYKLEGFDTQANQWYENAKINDEEGNIENAIKLYEEVLNINPNHFTTLSRLGELYLDCQDFSKAIKCYGRCYKLDTNSYKDSLVEAHLRYGKYYIQQKEFRSAKEEFNIVLKLEPQNQKVQEQLRSVEEEILNESKNPYHVGKFVPGENFIGRKEELRIVVDQILNSSRWVFYGSRAMGKTSFMKYLASPNIWLTRYEDDFPIDNYFFVYLDCKQIHNFTFSIFWEEILRELSISNPDFMFHEINQFLEEPYLNKNHVKQILQQIKNYDKFLVLLLDNYDGIFEQNHDNNEILKFLKEFQHLQEHELGNRLSTIMTASKDLSEIASKDMQDYLPYMSKPLKTFGNIEIADLWSRMPDPLKNKEDLRKTVQEITGGYPALIQILCYSLYNNVTITHEGTPTIETFTTLESEFNDLAEKTLKYIWESLNDTQKILLTLIALYHVAGKIDKKNYNVSDIEDILTKYKSDLGNLQKCGIILLHSVESERNIKQKKEVYYFAASVMQGWIIREIAKGDLAEVSKREKIFLIMTKGQLTNFTNGIKFISENFETVKNFAGGISTILNLLGV